MQMRIRAIKGLTLIEILISSLILTISVAGLVNLFVASKRYIAGTHNRLSSSELSKAFLDPLQSQVRFSPVTSISLDGWDMVNNPLMVPVGFESNPDFSGTAIVINGTTYAPTYSVSRVRTPLGVDTGMRRVTVTINWPQISMY